MCHHQKLNRSCFIHTCLCCFLELKTLDPHLLMSWGGNPEMLLSFYKYRSARVQVRHTFQIRVARSAKLAQKYLKNLWIYLTSFPKPQWSSSVSFSLSFVKIKAKYNLFYIEKSWSCQVPWFILATLTQIAFTLQLTSYNTSGYWFLTTSPFAVFGCFACNTHLYLTWTSKTDVSDKGPLML